MSHIWVPKFKTAEIEIGGKVGMEGWYRLQVRRPDERLRIDTGWFPNIITDAGLDAVGVSSDYLGQCRVGTGNTTPVAADTALVAQVGATTTVQSTSTTAQGSPPYYGATTKTFRFGAGVAAGNLAEIGIGIPSSTLFSRALILDGGGSPTTITVLSDEFLDATYQLRLKPPLSDVTDTQVISGVTYDRITRAGNVTNSTSWGTPAQGGGSNTFNFTLYSGNIAAITTLPSGSGFFGVAQNIGTYSTGTYQRDFRGTVGLNDHITPIRCIGYQMGAGDAMGHMQTQYDPTIPKDNTKIFTVTFRHIWGRGTP